MKLYNTLTRKVEELKPLKKADVTLYTCGPTVYLDPHIGNWRAFLSYDTLVRALQLEGYKVNRVMNITDVGHLTSDEDEGDKDAGEDKLVKTAKAQRKTAWQIAEMYTQRFLDGMKLLNLLTPTKLEKATDHIAEQIELIQTLKAKGYTYQIDDGIYFDTSKLTDYGKLKGEAATEQEQAGARVAVNPQKQNPRDFALWKFSPKDEQRDMEWGSPWGKGFPGWHLECSAIAMKYLGATLDIHSGGVDHIGTHHTNEIAQSEAATGKPFANLWVHNEHLLVDGMKMSKSKGNYYILDDLINKGFSPLAFRLLVLQAHYRSQINFTWDSLAAAQSFLQRLYAAAERRFQTTNEPEDEILPIIINGAMGDIVAFLANNLDTPSALGALSTFLTYIETTTLPKANLRQYNEFLAFLDKAFGLDLANRTDLTPDEKAILERREAARAAKDFALSDKLRTQLQDMKVGLDDTDFGTVWHRLI
ncbi:cysteine--tRNA ligase [Candidatus Microgenomates bacterium]|nr:cysteine--tRNA ligase [Candidatus Microgenomates bacterium]